MLRMAGSAKVAFGGSSLATGGGGGLGFIFSDGASTSSEISEAWIVNSLT